MCAYREQKEEVEGGSKTTAMLWRTAGERWHKKKKGMINQTLLVSPAPDKHSQQPQQQQAHGQGRGDGERGSSFPIAGCQSPSIFSQSEHHKKCWAIPGIQLIMLHQLCLLFFFFLLSKLVLNIQRMFCESKSVSIFCHCYSFLGETRSSTAST